MSVVLPPDTADQADTCGYVFGSAHSGVFQTVFCDGSVHTLQFDINGQTWVNLCSRDDGQELTLTISNDGLTSHMDELGY